MSALTPQVLEPGSVVQHPSGFTQHRRTAEEIVATRARVLEVMRVAMKEGIHYGTIPGTPKPTLYKPGADMLLSMFRWGAKPLTIEDLSTYDEIRYRVHVAVFDIASETTLEIAVGECSSNEAKYRWRKPVCNEEFDETPAERRRVVWKSGRDGAYQLHQVRTEPADIANTILKMAKKRAKVDAVIGATACGDVFGQDLEDLPDGWSSLPDDGDASTLAEEPGAEPQPAMKAPDAPAHLHVVSIRVVRASKQSDKNHPWKLYAVKFSDGSEPCTFSETIKKKADELIASKAAVDREIEHDDKHNRDTLVMLQERK